ncbi:MAG: ABC-F family ATP-binding cassette domain-containing protein [Myxococcota bacterium]
MILRARGIEKSFGDRPILRGADLTVHAGERVGLVGVNGSGKSTLVRIVAGAIEPDHGDLVVEGRLGVFEQDPRLAGETVGDAADAAVAWHRELLAAYEAALAAHDERTAAALHARLDEHGWQIGHRVDAMLSRVGAPPREARVERLSGGERRRVALAIALLGAPDLLLLDEPTNHLDADATEWLQGHLEKHRGALVLVTHDRYLLEAVATRIVEVEDGVCVSYDGSYADYLVARAERQAQLERADDVRMAMIAREAEWASRSPAARTTKQKARLDRLAALQATRPYKRDVAMELDLRTGLKHGSTVVELHGVKKARGGRVLFRDVELALRAGDRLGVLGPNGVGKTTLLRLLQGVEPPDAGTIVRGPRVRVAVLDQERSGLPLDVTVYEAAGMGNDQVRVGDRWIHVTGFLNRFLFRREHFGRPVSALSGGERARLLLARLLLQGANLLLLDEPTNDLDLQTLRVLEEALLGYDGVVVVVTHDRAFLDRVCTGVLAFADARITRYADRSQVPATVVAREEKAPVAQPKRAAPRKLTYKEQKELEALPARIEALEAEQAALTDRLGEPDLFKSAEGPAVTRRLGEIPVELEALYARWAELEAV